MGLQGLIYAAVAAVWLIYLVPQFLNRRDNGILEEVEPGEPFSASVTIVRRGTPLDTAENGTAVVSTPLNRRAAMREIADLDRGAAKRRRVVVIFLVLLAAITAVMAGFSLVSWWMIAVPVGMLGLFLVVARFSVRSLRRHLDARARVVRGGEDVDEHTVPIMVVEEAAADKRDSVELAAPVEATSSLWDPIPITAPTYVSRPLAPRTVRTIDLSAPIVAGSALPVTADLPEGAEGAGEAAAEASERPHAVGE